MIYLCLSSFIFNNLSRHNVVSGTGVVVVTVGGGGGAFLLDWINVFGEFFFYIFNRAKRIQAISICEGEKKCFEITHSCILNYV